MHNSFDCVVIEGDLAIFGEQILTILILHTKNITLSATVEAEAGLNQFALFIPDGKLFRHFTELIPGGRDIRLGQTSGAPHGLVVIHGSSHHAIVGIINLPIDNMRGNTYEVFFQIFHRDIVGSQVVNQVFVVAVVNVEDCGAVASLQRQGQLGPIIIIRILDQRDFDVGMNRGILIYHRLEQIRGACPVPEFNFNVFAIVYGFAGVVLDFAAENGAGFSGSAGYGK